MSDSTFLAVQSTADSLGIKFQKQQCLEDLAKDAEFRITQFLKPVILLKNKTHSTKLTCDHIKTIFKNYSRQQLYGYLPDSEYEIKEDSTEGMVFSYVKEPKVPLTQFVTTQLPKGNRDLPFDFRWKKVNGVNFDSASAKSRIQSKVMKSSQQSVQNAITSIFDTHQEQHTLKPLTPELKKYYTEAVEIISEGITDRFQSCFSTIQLSVGIGPTIPYFLRFFMAQIATHLHDPVRMLSVGKAARALVRNKTLPISLFAHPFMKIGFTLLLKQTMTGTVDQDIEIREIGAGIIIELIANCSSGYPGMKTEVMNQLSQTLFVPNQLFSQIYGCLYTLMSIDINSFINMLVHTRYIYQRAQHESENPYAQKTYQLITEYIQRFKEAYPKVTPTLDTVLRSF